MQEPEYEVVYCLKYYAHDMVVICMNSLELIKTGKFQHRCIIIRPHTLLRNY